MSSFSSHPHVRSGPGRRQIRPAPGALSVLLALVVGLCASPLGSGTAAAQERPTYYDYPRPQLDWRTIETPHFAVHYHEEVLGSEAERSARVVAEVAETVYGPITELYDYRPDGKVSIVLKDFNDYANGAAYFFDDVIEIWAPYLESELRGDHHWLRNVVAHEFTHIVQIQAGMKAGTHVPYAYLQYFRYEDVRRPDVLYGYPNGLASFPAATLNVPAWFAEGTAQFQRSHLHYDSWDTHRDMLLRMQVLEDRTLDLSAMGGFYSHDGLERESVYNHGFAFTLYLAERFGEEVLPEVTAELSRWNTFTVDDALEAVTGRSGEELHAAWLDSLGESYRRATRAVRANSVTGRSIVTEGSSNYHPRYAPSGDRLAYVSNRGRDYDQMSLYVRDAESGRTARYDLEGGLEARPRWACRYGGSLVDGISGSFTWRPDGEAIVYARKSDTREGFRYADLYEIDVATGERTRVTRKRRATQPAFGPDGERIVFVGQRGGTSNLYLLDRSADSIRALTEFGGGIQVGAPAWHPSGDWIYFERTDGSPRDIWRIRPGGGDPEPVRSRPWNERHPAFSPDGSRLYVAGDSTGVYNLYRMRPEGRGARPVTNVRGGAFMPSVRSDGHVAFARFRGAGYQIARLGLRTERVDRDSMAYRAPELLREERRPTTDLRTRRGPDSGPRIGALGRPDSTAFTSRPYEHTFAPFSIMPVYRLDMYAKDRPTFAGRMKRNSKAGVYFASREVLDRVRFTGGLMLGLGSQEATSLGDFFSPSRLVDLERDAFLEIDYSGGVGWIPRRWSPQLFVGFYNTRRNVDDGLAIEEFPCTACYPDTTYTDVAYTLWEAEVAFRSKLSSTLLAGISYRYSPYQVQYESFYSREQRQNVPGASDRYFIGRALSAELSYEALRPYRHSDVLPRGLRFAGGYELQPGRLLESYTLEEGQLEPEYREYANHRLWMESRVGFSLPGRLRGAPHGVTARLDASSVLGGPVDDFFDEYVGGLTGARGYPFYALGGNEAVWAQLSYHVPLIPSIGWQLGPIYADKLYGRVYTDFAAAWSGDWPGWSGVRRDVGAELRLGLGTFYLLPAAFFVSGTYGFDTFSVRLDEGFVTDDGRRTVRYGEEWRWHFGLLFDFDL